MKALAEHGGSYSALYRELVDDSKAEIVTRGLVTRAWVTESRNEEHGRYAALTGSAGLEPRLISFREFWQPEPRQRPHPEPQQRPHPEPQPHPQPEPRSLPHARSRGRSKPPSAPPAAAPKHPRVARDPWWQRDHRARAP